MAKKSISAALSSIYQNLPRLSKIEELKEALDKSFDVNAIPQLEKEIDAQIEIYRDLKDSIMFVNEHKERLIKLTYRFQHRYGRKLLNCVISLLETFEALQNELKKEDKSLFGRNSYEYLLLTQKKLLGDYDNYNKYIKIRRKEKKIIKRYASLFSGSTAELIRAEEKTSFIKRLKISLTSFPQYSFAGIAVSFFLILQLLFFVDSLSAQDSGFISEFMNSVRHVQIEAGYDSFSPRYKLQDVKANDYYTYIYYSTITNFLNDAIWDFNKEFASVHDGRFPNLDEVMASNLPSIVKKFYMGVYDKYAYTNEYNLKLEEYAKTQKFNYDDVLMIFSDSINRYSSYDDEAKAANLTKDQLISVIADVVYTFHTIDEGMSDKEIASKFSFLSRHKDENEQIYSLQMIGAIFSENYDDSRKGKYISLPDLLKGGAHFVKTGQKVPLGVCRHINTRLATIARDIFGRKSYVISIPDHVISGVVDDSGQVILLDYGSAYRTDANDIRDAMSYYERASGKVGTRYELHDADGNLVTTISSDAGEDKRAGFGLYNILDKSFEMLAHGGLEHEPNHLKISLHNYKKEIQLDNNWLALHYTRLDRSDFAYNSIEKMNLLFLGAQEKQEKYFAKGGVVWAKGKLKPSQFSAKNIYHELGYVMSAGGKFFDKHFADNWDLSMAAVSQFCLLYSLNLRELTDKELDVAFSSRLSYYNPNYKYRLFFGCGSDLSLLRSNVQGGRSITSNINFALHQNKFVIESGIIKTFGLSEVSVRSELAKTDIGYDVGLSAAYNSQNLSFEAYARKVISEMVDRGLPTIIPTTTDFGINLNADVLRRKGYTGSIGIYGDYTKRRFGLGIKDYWAEFGLNATIIF